MVCPPYGALKGPILSLFLYLILSLKSTYAVCARTVVFLYPFSRFIFAIYIYERRINMSLPATYKYDNMKDQEINNGPGKGLSSNKGCLSASRQVFP